MASHAILFYGAGVGPGRVVTLYDYYYQSVTFHPPENSRKKTPPERGFWYRCYPMWSCLGSHVRRLKAFGTILYIESNRLTFSQGFET